MMWKVRNKVWWYEENDSVGQTGYHQWHERARRADDIVECYCLPDRSEGGRSSLLILESVFMVLYHFPMCDKGHKKAPHVPFRKLPCLSLYTTADSHPQPCFDDAHA